jgi:TRAP transporter TAXI family solute receptor
VSTSRTITFTGASIDGPWGAAQKAVAAALKRVGVPYEFKSYDGEAASLPAHNRGEVDLGANFREQVDWAYRGFAQYAKEPLTNLRGLASFIQPQYVGIAATWESGITSLEQVAAERRPIRLFTVARTRRQTRTMGYITSRVLEEAGFDQDDVVAWGGRVLAGDAAGLTAIMQNDLDVMIIPAYSNYAPTWGTCWMQAQIRLNLRFLGIPEPTRDKLAAEMDLRKGTMPAGLFRGLDEDIPTFVAGHHTIVTHAHLSDQDAYAITRAIDENRDCLQEQHVPFGYDPLTAWQELGVPLHPGAEAYYREQGYLSRAPAAAVGA